MKSEQIFKHLNAINMDNQMNVFEHWAKTIYLFAEECERLHNITLSEADLQELSVECHELWDVNNCGVSVDTLFPSCLEKMLGAKYNVAIACWVLPLLNYVQSRSNWFEGKAKGCMLEDPSQAGDLRKVTKMLDRNTEFKQLQKKCQRLEDSLRDYKDNNHKLKQKIKELKTELEDYKAERKRRTKEVQDFLDMFD